MPKGPESGASGQFDLIVAADMTRGGDAGLRIATEAQVAADLGMRAGLLHLPEGQHERVSADVHGALRRRWAAAIDLQGEIETKLLVVYAAGGPRATPPGLAGLRAQTVVLVVDDVPEPSRLAEWLPLTCGPLLLAPTNRWVRAGIEALQLPLPMEEADWRTSVASAEGPGKALGARLQLGLVVPADNRERTALPTQLEAMLPRGDWVDVHLFGATADGLAGMPRLTAPHGLQAASDFDVACFLSQVDVLACFPTAPGREMPEAAIALAMAAGKPVAMPPAYHPHFGAGLLYCDIDQVVGRAVALLRRPKDRDAAAETARAEAGRQFPRAAHAERLTRLAGFAPVALRAPPTPRKRRPSVLFVPSNGVGLGHVSRLLAIANRVQGHCDTAFATLAQAASIVESFGHVTHYLPSLSDTKAEMPVWDAWFRLELERLIELHDADVVVFDGNNPTPGLVHAARSQPPCRLAWVRRAMGKAGASPFLHLSGLFDLIIEPGELAEAYDRGATAARRHEVERVEPIRLLDLEDLLPRTIARAELGLDPQRPAVLIQLGAGAHRNVVDLTDAAVRALQGHDGAQIVIAEWENGVVPMSLWPGTQVVSGFPMSRYTRAFDFSISAAGYNSFHEAIEFGLPTVFVGNSHPAIDDQVARASMAQEAGAAIELPEDELYQLPAICELLLEASVRDVLRARCQTLRRPNGAVAAAALITRLAGA